MKVIKKLITLFAMILTCIMPINVELAPIDLTKAVTAGKYSLLFDCENGRFSVAKGDDTIFENAVSAYRIGGKTIRSSDYTHFNMSCDDIDGGKKITATMSAADMLDLTQTFYLYDEKEYFTTQVSIQSESSEVKTNYIAPLLIENGGLQNDAYKWTNSLEVPFDNDGWAEFNVKSLFEKSQSYEVGALFMPDDGAGFIMGSLSHEVWKTGVTFSGMLGKIKRAVLYCGATDPKTGNEPHGTVSGKTVDSPLMFIGVYDNWKDGMNEFATVNTEIQPKRTPVTNHVPIGWNSWGSVQTDLSYDIATGISQYVKDNFQDIWQKNGSDVYINLDSFWDWLSDDELKSFVNYCHSNNQKAGIYWGPFVSWLDEESMKTAYVPGTNNTVTYEEIRLKKADGTYYGNEVDGCYPLDVTHTAVQSMAETFIGRFKAADFDYIKLDFLVHGSFEGDFYNDEIQTGIQAYNYAMNNLTKLIGDDIFINLAMSPTFPYQYANGRRLACDSYYHIGETEYTLNSVTYGFWEQKLYDYTDPDHIVVWGRDADATEAEARSRVTSGVISGTSFLAGDNFVNPNGDVAEAHKRFAEMLGNEDIISVAQTGKIFTPVISNVINRSANVFKMETDGKLYVAVLNYNNITRIFKVELGDGKYKAVELWTGKEKTVSGTLQVQLKGNDSAIYELVPIE